MSVQAGALERAKLDLRLTDELIRFLAGAPPEELVEVGKVERPFRRNNGELVPAGTPLSAKELAAMPRSHKEALIATNTISVWPEWRRLNGQQVAKSPPAPPAEPRVRSLL